MCQRYPDYRVSISGMGELPENSDKTLGKCSQMAVFVRKDMLEILSNNSTEEIAPSSDRPDSDVVFPINKIQYELLFSKEYPYHCDTRSTEQKILDDVKYFIHRHLTADDVFFNEDRDICEFPVEEIFKFVHDADDLDEMRTIIRKEHVINDKDCVEQKLDDESDYEQDDDYDDYDDQRPSSENIVEQNRHHISDDELWE